MNGYVAIVRLHKPQTRHAVAAAAQSCVASIRGVDRTTFDAPSNSLMVWFDRALVSLGEIVRCLDDAGLRVAAVSQMRAEVGHGVHSATA